MCLTWKKKPCNIDCARREQRVWIKKKNKNGFYFFAKPVRIKFTLWFFGARHEVDNWVRSETITIREVGGDDWP